MEDFQNTIRAIIRGGATRERGVAEAVAFASAMLDSLKPECTKLIAENNKLEASLDALYTRAQKTQSEEDVIKLSEAQAPCHRLSKMLLESIKMYSAVSEELSKLQRFETLRRAPIVPAFATIDTLRNKVAKLVGEMCQHWSTYDDSMEPRTESVEQIAGPMQIADVRGDGACGPRAFITGVIRIITGGQVPKVRPVHLSYDPARMIEFVAKVKVLMLELVQFLSQNPGNQEFITALYNNPDNGAVKTFASYKAMVSNPAYHMTNFELRLLCVLFGMFDPRLSQVNIIRKTPKFGEQYQSLSASGQIEPVSNEHINILHVPGHYMSIVHLTEGVLPRIYPVEAPLQL